MTGPAPQPPGELLATFASAFGAGATRVVRAPGRVNLVGEHIDYCGLPVFPMAIPQATWLLVRPREDALVRLAFTPCLQYQYAAGKNTADIALALDAMEAMFDRRADTFCLVTSDSDFAYLCRKLRERGATVHIIGGVLLPG